MSLGCCRRMIHNIIIGSLFTILAFVELFTIKRDGKDVNPHAYIGLVGWSLIAIISFGTMLMK